MSENFEPRRSRIGLDTARSGEKFFSQNLQNAAEKMFFRGSLSDNGYLIELKLATGEETIRVQFKLDRNGELQNTANFDNILVRNGLYPDAVLDDILHTFQIMQ